MNNRLESDHAAPKQLIRPMRGFRDLSSATATLKGIEAFRAIRKAEFDGRTKGVAHEIGLVTNLFMVAARNQKHEILSGATTLMQRTLLQDVAAVRWRL